MNMPARKSDQIVDTYLRSVDRAMTGVPAEQRKEILADLRSHIDAELSDSPSASEAQVRQIIERLGSPEAVAAEARGDGSVSAKASPRRWPIFTAVAVAVLVALGVLVYFMFFAFSVSHS